MTRLFADIMSTRPFGPLRWRDRTGAYLRVKGTVVPWCLFVGRCLNAKGAYKPVSTVYMYYRGDFLTAQKGNVCASSWMDRKVVTVMSTNGQPESGSVTRRQKDGSRISVPCPISVVDYNKFMGGVDRGDQIRGYYSCRTKCRKFYKQHLSRALSSLLTTIAPSSLLTTMAPQKMPPKAVQTASHMAYSKITLRNKLIPF